MICMLYVQSDTLLPADVFENFRNMCVKVYELDPTYVLSAYLTGEEILPSTQQQIIEQAKFTYFLLGKAFEKQTITIKIKEKNKLML